MPKLCVGGAAAAARCFSCTQPSTTRCSGCAAYAKLGHCTRTRTRTRTRTCIGTGTGLCPCLCLCLCLCLWTGTCGVQFELTFEISKSPILLRFDFPGLESADFEYILRATLNKSLAARASPLRAVRGVENPRHSPGYECGFRLAAHPEPGRAYSRGLIQRRLRLGVKQGEMSSNTDPELTAVILLGALRGVMQQWLLDDRIKLPAVRDRLLSIVTQVLPTTTPHHP